MGYPKAKLVGFLKQMVMEASNHFKTLAGVCIELRVVVIIWHRTTEKNATETERESREADWADRSLFVQELLLALMSESSDVIQPGIFSEQECWSSVDDLQLSDSDGLLSKLAHSPSASSQHDSTSSLAGVYNDADSAAVAVPRAAENCEPIGKDSFSVDVSNCGTVGGLEVACTRAGVL